MRLYGELYPTIKQPVRHRAVVAPSAEALGRTSRRLGSARLCSPEEQQARLQTCHACESLKDGRCQSCRTCGGRRFVAEFVQLSLNQCPKSKWPKLP